MFTSPFHSILRSRDKNYEKAVYYPWPGELYVTSPILPFRAFLTVLPFPVLHTSLIAAATLPSCGHVHVIADSLCEPSKRNSDTTSDCLEIET